MRKQKETNFTISDFLRIAWIVLVNSFFLETLIDSPFEALER